MELRLVAIIKINSFFQDFHIVVKLYALKKDYTITIKQSK